MTRIAILTPTLTSADAVSNDVLTMRRVLRERGHDVRIFAENSNLAGEQIEAPAAALSYLRNAEDVLIYHHSIGCDSGVATMRFRSFRRRVSTIEKPRPQTALLMMPIATRPGTRKST